MGVLPAGAGIPLHAVAEDALADLPEPRAELVLDNYQVHNDADRDSLGR
jgi:hypothetical protein